MSAAETQTSGEVAGDSSTQTGQPALQMFDLAADDRMEEVRQGLDDEVDAQAQSSARKAENLQRTISRHMGEAVGPGVADFAHMMASSSAAASSESPESRPTRNASRDQPRKKQAPPPVKPKAPDEPPALPSEVVRKEKAKSRAKSVPSHGGTGGLSDSEIVGAPSASAGETGEAMPPKLIEFATRAEFVAWSHTKAAEKKQIQVQLELREYPFTPEQLRGSRSKTNPVKAMGKPQLLEILEGLLKF